MNKLKFKPLDDAQQRLPKCITQELFYEIDVSHNGKIFCGTVILQKFGYEFVKKHLETYLKDLVKKAFCSFELIDQIPFSHVLLKLNWPVKLSAREVKEKLNNGLTLIESVLKTMKVVKCDIDKSYIHEFQLFCQDELKQELNNIEVFFDYEAGEVVMISDADPSIMRTALNTAYQIFMSDIAGKLKKENNEVQEQISNLSKHINGMQMDGQFLHERDFEEKDLILFDKTKLCVGLEMKNKFLKIALDSKNNKVTVIANNKDTAEGAVVELIKASKDYMSLNNFTHFSQEQLELLGKQDVCKQINSLFEQENLTAHFHCSNNSVSLHHVKTADTTRLQEIIESFVVWKEKTLDVDEVLALNSEQGQTFLADLPKSKDINVNSILKLEPQKHHLLVVTRSSFHDLVLEKISQFLTENKLVTKEVLFPCDKQDFVQRFLKGELTNIQTIFTHKEMRLTQMPGKFLLKGLRDCLNEGERRLSQLRDSVIVHIVPLQYYGIVEFLKTNEGESLIKKIEDEHFCVIQLQSKITPSSSKAPSAVLTNSIVKSGSSPTPSLLNQLHRPRNISKHIETNLVQGEITQQKTDAIVISVGQIRDLRNRGAAEYVLINGGSTLQQELNSKYPNGIEPYDFALSSGGNLHCKHVFYAVMSKWTGQNKPEMSQLLKKILNAAEKLDVVAHTITEIISKFAEENTLSTLKRVNLVVFPKDVQIFQAFQTVLAENRSRESDNNNELLCSGGISKLLGKRHQGGLFYSSVTDIVSKVDTGIVSSDVNLVLYSDSQIKIDAARMKLQKAVKEAFGKETEEDDEIKKFSDQQQRQLVDLGLQYCVEVTVKVKEGCVIMQGFNPKGFIKIHKMVKDLVKTVLKEYYRSLQEALSAIQWQFEDGNKWQDFDVTWNGEIEKEHKNNTKCFTTEKDSTKYYINFGDSKMYLLDDKNQLSKLSINIRRQDHTKESIPLPKKWDPMDYNDNLKVVTVDPTTKEFLKVQDRFIKKGCRYKIKKIERIQNKYLYQQYQVKKREMEHRNPKGHQNEQKLYHGTKLEFVSSINENGFSRNYKGKNGVAHGNGVYFAVNSSYSASYATSDNNGDHRMYQVKVLTGVSTPGRRGIDYLPNKSGTNTPYDSGTAQDMYVIFHDAQAYPEYSITF